MRNSIACFALLSVVLFLQNDARADIGGYMLLAPSSEVTLEIHGVCKTLRNLTDDASIYIPTGAKDLWSDMDNRTDENDHPVLEVTSCE